MNFIAVTTTFLIGFLGYLFIGTDLACVFSITTMGYFILKKLDKLIEENKKKNKEEIK